MERFLLPAVDRILGAMPLTSLKVGRRLGESSPILVDEHVFAGFFYVEATNAPALLARCCTGVGERNRL